MPAKNIIKEYVENGYYHIYNRGVEKRDIFLDEQDCKVFLYYLKLYLSPIEVLKKLQLENLTRIRIDKFIPNNLSKELDLLSFALMPNHIHLLIKQYTRDAITKFVRRICTGYVMFFNKKYKRVGPLFQNTYKAVFIDSDEYLLHLSRYIHLNSSRTDSIKINFSDFSSYPYYLGLKNASWIKPQEILEYFRDSQGKDLKGTLTYQNFIEDYNVNNAENLLESLIIEDNDDSCQGVTLTSEPLDNN